MGDFGVMWKGRGSRHQVITVRQGMSVRCMQWQGLQACEPERSGARCWDTVAGSVGCQVCGTDQLGTGAGCTGSNNPFCQYPWPVGHCKAQAITNGCLVIS